MGPAILGERSALALLSDMLAVVSRLLLASLRGLLAPARLAVSHVPWHAQCDMQPLPAPAAAAARAEPADEQPPEQPQGPLPPGYNAGVEALRRAEFKRLQGCVYADYAGAAPYSERLLAEVLAELSTSLHGNPHSEAGWGESRGAAADAARRLTLAMCRADPQQYLCIFTPGATAALKLVGESFPWGPASAFLHLRDNHTSVLGIRQLAAQHGAACTAAASLAAAPAAAGGGEGAAACPWQLVPCSPAGAAGLEAAARAAAAAASEGAAGGEPQHLFALPLESNFSGARYDQQLINAVQGGSLRLGSSAADSAGSGSSSSSGSSSAQALPRGRWRVLLDAAKGAGTAPPDLAAHPADFVALSYYKICGYPTGKLSWRGFESNGLGALLVRRDALACLRRRYFGGGTVEVALADEPFHSLRPGPAGWEDGTPPFLDFPAVAAGLRFVERLGGFPAVAAHAGAVAASLAGRLSNLRHWNGAPVCELYSSWPQQGQEEGQPQQQQQQQQQFEQQQQQQPGVATAPPRPPGVAGQGPVVTFNLRRADGSPVGYREVEKLASLSGILLRTGCCCNPGACATALGLTAGDMRANFEAGHVCWDERDVLGGRPTGAVRASFGFASSLADAAAVAALVERFFLEAAPAGSAGPAPQRSSAAPGEWGAAGAAGAAAEAVQAATSPPNHQPAGTVASLWVFPIKSCRGFSPAAWPLGPSGLLYDRCWALVDASGAALRLKHHPALATISAAVDLQRRRLVVTATGQAEPLEVALPEAPPLLQQPSSASDGSSSSGASACQQQREADACGAGAASTSAGAGVFSVRACARTALARSAASVAGGSAEVAAWFTRVLGLPCRLVQQAQQQPARQDASGGGRRSSGSFANEAQLLVVGAASLADLAARSASADTPDLFAQRFRPNLVIGGTQPYAEDSWRIVRILCTAGPGAATAAGRPGLEARAPEGGSPLSSAVVLRSAGPCTRCDMVCADPATGKRSGPEPLLTLAGYRRSRGRISFGLLANLEEQPQRWPLAAAPWVAVGAAVHAAGKG